MSVAEKKKEKKFCSHEESEGRQLFRGQKRFVLSGTNNEINLLFGDGSREINIVQLLRD